MSRQLADDLFFVTNYEIICYAYFFHHLPTRVWVARRSNRLYDFSSLEEVETILNSMMAAEHPLIARLPRQSGQKEARYAHLLSGEVRLTEPEPEPDRIAKLEKEVEDLKIK